MCLNDPQEDRKPYTITLSQFEVNILRNNTFKHENPHIAEHYIIFDIIDIIAEQLNAN
jgi:hypothetical protein